MSIECFPFTISGFFSLFAANFRLLGGVNAGMRFSSFAVLAVACSGCAAPRFAIPIDSEPPGARVFWSAGANEGMANVRNYIGQTPCTWFGERNGDGTFKASGIVVYSSFVQPVVVVTAEPPDGATNAQPKRQVFHLGAMFQPGDKVPERLLFQWR
jgi:hypothetical protein